MQCRSAPRSASSRFRNIGFPRGGSLPSRATGRRSRVPCRDRPGPAAQTLIDSKLDRSASDVRPIGNGDGDSVPRCRPSFFGLRSLCPGGAREARHLRWDLHGRSISPETRPCPTSAATLEHVPSRAPTRRDDAAMGFLVLPAAGFRRLQAGFEIGHARRGVLPLGVTASPSERRFPPQRGLIRQRRGCRRGRRRGSPRRPRRPNVDYLSK